ncbi:hypothetical protein C9413_03170 [Rhizobium sp. SEMIA 4085]|uniref:Antibiotic biosynthesis monooxygenase protein n=1 Tax=Rhizobium gallicum bv. gallicum R602sp TaxID=1041138 RepID=A0A0B4XHU7_9HYPH|nr:MULTISPECIES: hypothetical protein [Rhizobium]AJD46178.1 hypothetical protein RGR602_PC02158 [Rhizobium gallicum bv. gallicum R602sp]NNH28537.1 hypothetical protein [Rhizobium sp. SEMIA 4085]TDW32396.1 hypothetical protein EV128_107265 [Rhizobium azibense]
MSKPIVEIAAIRLKLGVTEAGLIAASDAAQNLLRGTDGFMRRELLKQADAEHANLVRWRSQADADAIMAAAVISPECAACFALMDMDGADPTRGLRHFTTLATYGEH